MSKELCEGMEKVLDKEIVDRHSFFQLKYFVIGKEPTIQSKLWRCLRELKSRKEAIDGINMEIEETQDQLAILELNAPNDDTDRMVSESDEKLDEIKKRQFVRRKKAIEKTLDQLQQKLKYTEEEARFFLEAYQSLEKKESLKPYDDLESQTAYWNEKLSQELNLSLMLRRPVELELVKTILALGNDTPIKKSTIHMFEKVHQQMALLEAQQDTEKGKVEGR